MSLVETYKLLHVLAAIVWVGGTVLALIFTWRALGATREHRLGLAADTLFLANRVFAPAAVIAALFGILMVLEVDAFSFSDIWIILGIGGLLLSMVLGMAFFGPQTTRLIAELTSNDPRAEGRLAIIAKVSTFDAAILVVVVWAMVTKPGL